MAITNLERLTGINRKILFGKFGQDVLWNIASLAVLAVCGVLLNIIIGWFYDSSVLGIFNQVYAVYIVFSQFGVMGIHLSVMKHVAQYANEKEVYRSSITGGLLLSITFAIISCLVFWSIRSLLANLLGSPGVATGMAYATIGLFFYSINKVMLSALNGLSRIKAFAIYQGMRYILMIVALIGASLFHSPGASLGLIFTVAETCLFLALLPTLWKEFGPLKLALLKPWFSNHFDFGMRGFMSNVLMQLNTRVDVLILGYFLSDRLVGIYSFAAILAEGVYQLPGVLQINFNPILVQLTAKDHFDELKDTVKKGMRFTYLGMLVIGVLIVALYPLAVPLVTNKGDFMQSWPLFAILMTGIVLCSGYTPFGNIILAAGRPGLHTIMITIQVLFNVVANIFLVQLWGITGSAIATALAYTLSAVLIVTFTRIVLKVRI
jgi:O-antigen/teichoic acid export membrane protein